MITNEHEGFIYQIVYIGIAIAILSLTVALFAAAAGMWDVFSVQDAASENMQDYAGFAAYDDNTIRGQEMINLVGSTKGDPFVVVMDSSNNILVTSFNEVTQDVSIDVKACTKPSAMSQLEAGRVQLATDFAIHGTVSGLGETYWDYSHYMVTNENIQTWFLNRGNGNYKAYQTCIIYDGERSNTVIGILAVEV